MKKILIILTLFYSFAFSEIVTVNNQFLSTNPELCPSTFQTSGGETYGDKSYVGYSSVSSSTNGMTRYNQINSNPRIIRCWESAMNWHGLSGSYSGYYNYTVIPTCVPEIVLNTLDDGWVEVAKGISDSTSYIANFKLAHPDVQNMEAQPGDTCGNNSYINAENPCNEGYTLLPDGTTYSDAELGHFSCGLDDPYDCGDGNHFDVQHEQCVPDCIPLEINNPKPNEWINFGITVQDTCMNKLTYDEIDGTFITQDDGCGSVVKACFGEPESPCDTVLSPEALRPSNFIYKNIVPNVSTCSSYVDGVNYISSDTVKIDDDCSRNNDYYCYLLPLRNDDNLTNTDDEFPVENEDGTVDKNDTSFNELPLKFDNNLSSAELNNLMIQDLKDNLQDTSLDIKDFHHWVKNKFGKWEPIQDAQNQLKATNDTTKAVKGTTAAVNSQTDILGGKLDTINDSIQDLDVNGTNSLLQDLLDKNDTKVDLNLTNDLLQQILDGNGTELDGNGTSFFTDTYNNLKSQYDNVNSQVDSAIDFINGSDLSTVVTSKSVSSCPKSFTFSLKDDLQKEFEIDPCIVLSQSREYMYTFSYIGFSSMFIGFIISMIVGI